MTASMFGGHLPAPMLPTLHDAPFDSDDWLFELKWDGVRAICLVERGSVVAVSRTGRDLLGQFPELDGLRGSFRRLPVVVDGEIVSLDARGRSSFQRLQSRLNKIHTGGAAVAVHFAAFDLLGQAKADLRDRPLDERKRLLEEALRDGDRFALCSKHVVGKGIRLFDRAKNLGVEGIVAKQRGSRYHSGRTREWLKVKAVHEQEFVIVGWTEPRGSRHHFGALLLGFYADGQLKYAGHVGTGFDAGLLRDLARRLAPLETNKSPLLARPKTNAPVHWVRPRLVAQIKFGEWTRDDILRQPVFLGLRIDKRPEEVVREEPAPRRRGKR